MIFLTVLVTGQEWAKLRALPKSSFRMRRQAGARSPAASRWQG
jgi:hypothetical protein